MAKWAVYADKKLLYANGVQADSGRVLINPLMTEEINSAGSFECGVPNDNVLYNKLKLRTTTIEIKNDDKVCWVGRPLSCDIGYNRTMDLTCEGALAFLNDTVYPPDTCKLRLTLFLKKVIDLHNEHCNVNRQIHVGSVTVDDVEIDYNGSYTQTMEVVKDLVSTYGGYLIPHYTEGGCYFDWLKDIPIDAKETINVEEIVDVSKAISADNVVTCVIPVGKDGLTIGTEYIENEAAAALFGRVWGVVEFGDIEDPDELYRAGLEYLNNNLWSSMQLEVEAANAGNEFQIGKMYHAHIPSFNINHDIAAVKREVSLVDGSAQKISFSAATIWTQINNGRDIGDVVDATQHLKLAADKALTTRTAKMESLVKDGSTYFSGQIQFSDGTNLNVTNGMITGGKSAEGDF